MKARHFSILFCLGLCLGALVALTGCRSNGTTDEVVVVGGSTVWRNSDAAYYRSYDVYTRSYNVNVFGGGRFGNDCPPYRRHYDSHHGCRGPR